MAEDGKRAKDSECIQVVVRCRPFNKKEKDESRSNIIQIDIATRQVAITNAENAGEQPKSYTFDGAFDETTQQRFFYEESCFPIVESVMEGFNSTIFAYGQTGCGKSWTMQGPPSPPELRGVIPNSFSHIFEYIKSTKGVEFLVRCSYLEIYNEEIRDLLGAKSNIKCELKEDPVKGVFVKNLTDVVVKTEAEMSMQLEKGLESRTVAATNMNAESSRSHSIFTIVVEMSFKDEESGKEHIKAGKLNLVDLAGSERQKKTGSTGVQLKEGSKINLSLSVLGNVISALADGKSKHIPYRDSKLTRMLQDSLGGNTKTLMVAAISPADYNYDETLSTLRYANRAKNIKNKPKINEDPKDTMLREFKEEIEKLRKMLADQARGGAGGDPAAMMSMNMMMMPGGAAASSVACGAGDSRAALQSDGGACGWDFAAMVPVEPVIQERIVVEREIVHVERISDEHMHKHHQLEQQSLTLEHERNLAHEQLRQKETEIEQERRQREDLLARLAQLQSKVMHVESAEVVEESAEDARDRQEAEKRHKERKSKARKRKEMQQQLELQEIIDEKYVMEQELEELRQSLLEAGTNATKKGVLPSAAEFDSSAVERKLSKLKRKYERRLLAAQAELEDTKDDFYFQKQQLLDSMKEQDKDARLYEQICRAVLTDKELKKIVDKSYYDEDEDEWVIPCTKKKSVALDTATAASTGAGLSGHAAGSTVSSGMTLPDIHMGQPKYYGVEPVIRAVSRGGAAQGGAAVSSAAGRLRPRPLNDNNNSNSSESSNNNNMSPRGVANGGTPRVPMLTLPANSFAADPFCPNEAGSSVTATGVTVSTSLDTYTYANNTLGAAAAAAVAPTGKKKKKSHKPPKVKPQQEQLLMNITDEAGSGETAGPISDWGFIYSGEGDGEGGMAGGHNGAPRADPEYSDDEDFETGEGDDAGQIGLAESTNGRTLQHSPNNNNNNISYNNTNNNQNINNNNNNNKQTNVPPANGNSVAGAKNGPYPPVGQQRGDSARKQKTKMTSPTPTAQQAQPTQIQNVILSARGEQGDSCNKNQDNFTNIVPSLNMKKLSPRGGTLPQL